MPNPEPFAIAAAEELIEQFGFEADRLINMNIFRESLKLMWVRGGIQTMDILDAVQEDAQ